MCAQVARMRREDGDPPSKRLQAEGTRVVSESVLGRLCEDSYEARDSVFSDWVRGGVADVEQVWGIASTFVARCGLAAGRHRSVCDRYLTGLK